MLIELEIFYIHRSPDSNLQWPKYIAGDSYIHEICNTQLSECNVGRKVKEVAFWLQYLPRLSNKLMANEQAEKITTPNGRLKLQIYY